MTCGFSAEHYLYGEDIYGVHVVPVLFRGISGRWRRYGTSWRAPTRSRPCSAVSGRVSCCGWSEGFRQRSSRTTSARAFASVTCSWTSTGPGNGSHAGSNVLQGCKRAIRKGDRDRGATGSAGGIRRRRAGQSGVARPDQRSSPMPEVHLEDPEWEGWMLCGERLRPARGETVGLL